MKRLIVGLVTVGAIIALRSVAGRAGQRMREHCQQMAGKCRQMMASRSEELSGAREHCKETMASHGGDTTPEPSEQPAPKLAGHGEAVAV